jgi:hypothetical protein
MQYIQLQGQVAADLDLPLEGSYNLFIDTSDNSIKAKDSEGNLIGGGGISLIETTREAVGELITSASLTPGAFYKIAGAASQSFLDTNEFNYSGYGNEIQKGGTTIILQATTDKTLSKKGIGLFYVPNYEDPNNPTLPPDYNYKTWDNTHRIYLMNVEGRFELNSTIDLYSDDTENSTTAILQGSLEGSGSGDITFVLDDNDTFFEDANNLNQLQLSQGEGSAYGEIDGLDYTSSYSPGNKVIFGGRVWQNLSGSIGFREGGNDWPTNVLNLNPEDWTPVAFNETDYTISADLIEYDFEHDNISYRNDGKNEVRCEWYWWDDNYGYNTIGYFPWGHKVVNDVSFTNTYLHHFVNFPWDSEAGHIKFGHNSLFNATTWGHGSYFYSMYGENGADFGSHRFGPGTDIYDITFGIDAEMRNIQTCGSNVQIYQITIGSDAYFGDIDMYYDSQIYNIELGTEASFGYSEHQEYTNVYNVNLGINAELNYFTLSNNSEIKDVTIGNYSDIQYFNLAYSSCLKRITLANEAYIRYFDLGADSFVRQVNLSDRAYINEFAIGDEANLQNIDLGAYAYMYDLYGGNFTDFQNIRLDAQANIYNINLGYQSELTDIQIAPDSELYNIYGGGPDGGFTGSSVSGITIQPNSQISNITIGSNSNFGNIYVGTDVYLGGIELEEASSFNDINLMGDIETGGNTLIKSGSSFRYSNLGMNGSFGNITISGSVESPTELSHFDIGSNRGFSGMTFTSSLSNIGITNAFSNLLNTATQSLDATAGGNNNPLIDFTNRSIVTIDITGATDPYSYDLPDGDYEGQELTFVAKSDGTHTIESTQINIWTDKLVTSGDSYGLEARTNGFYAFRPFARYNGTTWDWRNVTKVIWTGGTWVTDAEAFND